MTTVFTVQEIWGDGDSNPTLTNLKIFTTKNKADNYCHERWIDF